MVNDALRLALVGLDAFDAAITHVVALLVFSVQLGRCRAAFPIGARLPQLDGLAHPCLDTLGILARPAFAVMANQDGLAQGDAGCNGLHAAARCVGLLAALLAVVLEALGPLAGALHQGAIFIPNFAAPLQHQVGPARCPHGSDKKLLARRPTEARKFGTLIVLGAQSRERIEPQFVVLRAIGGSPQVFSNCSLVSLGGCGGNAHVRCAGCGGCGGRASSRVTSRHFDHGRSSRVFISRSNRPYGLTCSQISGVRAA